MKKSWVVKLISGLLAVALVCSLSGCHLQDKKEDDYILSKKAERKIKEAYLADSQNNDLTADDIVIKHYLGNYNGSLAVMIEGDGVALQVDNGVKVAEIIFLWRREVIAIYKSGSVYYLPVAYERGFLKKSDLEKLSERYLALYPHLNPDKIDLTGWHIIG